MFTLQIYPYSITVFTDNVEGKDGIEIRVRSLKLKQFGSNNPCILYLMALIFFYINEIYKTKKRSSAVVKLPVLINLGGSS